MFSFALFTRITPRVRSKSLFVCHSSKSSRPIFSSFPRAKRRCCCVVSQVVVFAGALERATEEERTRKEGDRERNAFFGPLDLSPSAPYNRVVFCLFKCHVLCVKRRHVLCVKRRYALDCAPCAVRIDMTNPRLGMPSARSTGALMKGYMLIVLVAPPSVVGMVSPLSSSWHCEVN